MLRVTICIFLCLQYLHKETELMACWLNVFRIILFTTKTDLTWTFNVYHNVSQSSDGTVSTVFVDLTSEACKTKSYGAAETSMQNTNSTVWRSFPYNNSKYTYKLFSTMTTHANSKYATQKCITKNNVKLCDECARCLALVFVKINRYFDISDIYLKNELNDPIARLNMWYKQFDKMRSSLIPIVLWIDEVSSK